MKTIAIIASCDTKLKELSYMKTFIENAGQKVLVIDVSIGLEQPTGYDIPREKLIEAAGYKWDDVKTRSKGELMELAIAGSKKLIPSLYSEGAFDAIISMGGVQNTSVAVSGMKELPIGVLKLCFLQLPVGIEHLIPSLEQVI